MEDYVTIPDQYFPVSITLHHKTGPGPIFKSHWHQHFQFIYCLKGTARIYCNGLPVHLDAGEVMVINTNEMHYGESLNGDISYYVIMVDLSFMFSRGIDSCQIKYISPLAQNRLLFENQINHDDGIRNCISKMIAEYNARTPGYELAVKACVYNAMVLLLRNHATKSLSSKENEIQTVNMKRFQNVFHYIEENLARKIGLHEMAAIANLSSGHFCRIFTKLTGKSPISYLNQLRIEKAIALLEQGEGNISEIAFAAGFSDSNYFSRVFKKYQGMTPGEFRKSILNENINQ
jgi:AraC-like DNA-binding protein